MSKNFFEIVRLLFEKRDEWIREIRGEILQGIADGRSSSVLILSARQPRCFLGEMSVRGPIVA